MKKQISVLRKGSSIAAALWVCGVLVATSSAQSPVDWNAGDPMLQFQQRLAEQPPAPPVSAKAVDAETEPIALADPALAGDYRLKEILVQGFPEKLRSHYCPDRLKVVLDDPARRVTVCRLGLLLGQAPPGVRTESSRGEPEGPGLPRGACGTRTRSDRPRACATPAHR